MNKRYINTKVILFTFLTPFFGAQLLHSASTSTAPWHVLNGLTKEEQEAIDADIAFELTKKEEWSVHSNYEELKRQEMADARFAQELQMQEYQNQQRGRPVSSPTTQQQVRPQQLPVIASPKTVSKPTFTCLPLPQEMNAHAVFHVKTKQLNNFSCGYNALFNAANFEQQCGYHNTVHDYSVFAEKVLACLQSEGVAPTSPTSNDIIDVLANHILTLQPVHNIRLTPAGTVEQLHNEGVSYTFRHGASQAEIQQKLKQAVEKRRLEALEDIKARFNQEGPVIMHFLCYVLSAQGIPHGVLISVTKNGTGKGLYIFDNLNEPLGMNSEIARIATCLCSHLQISSRETFTGPALPTIWPSIQTMRY